MERLSSCIFLVVLLVFINVCSSQDGAMVQNSMYPRKIAGTDPIGPLPLGPTNRTSPIVPTVPQNNMDNLLALGLLGDFGELFSFQRHASCFQANTLLCVLKLRKQAC